MDTKTAATKAGVTIATIRCWARYGSITATKTHGKWDIQSDSLEHRMSLSAKPAKPARHRPLTADAILALGGSRWIKGNMDRIYLDDWAQYAGIEVEHYGTGSVCWAEIGGRRVANGRIGSILSTVSKVYFDCTDGKLYVKHYGADSIEVRYLDGQREDFDLFRAICDGVKDAAAAL